MKKYCFFMMLLVAGFASFGQSLDDINKLRLLGQNKKAKDALDKFLSDPKKPGITKALLLMPCLKTVAWQRPML